MIQQSQNSTNQNVSLPRFDLPTMNTDAYTAAGAEALEGVGKALGGLIKGITTVATFTACAVKKPEQFKQELGEYVNDLKQHCKAEAQFGVEFIKMSAVNAALHAQAELSVGDDIQLGVVGKIQEAPVSADGKQHLTSLYKDALKELTTQTEGAIAELDARKGFIHRYQYMEERSAIQDNFANSIATLQKDVEGVIESVSVDAAAMKAAHNQGARHVDVQDRKAYEPTSFKDRIDSHWQTLRQESHTKDLPQWARPGEVQIPERKAESVPVSTPVITESSSVVAVETAAQADVVENAPQSRVENDEAPIAEQITEIQSTSASVSEAVATEQSATPSKTKSTRGRSTKSGTSTASKSRSSRSSKTAAAEQPSEYKAEGETKKSRSSRASKNASTGE